MRFAKIGVLLVFLGAHATARAEVNLIRQLTTAVEGKQTVITLHGSVTPNFTAYRLEHPSRLVVDLADAQFPSNDGPVEVDTWAVSQLATAQYGTGLVHTGRVMIGLRRSCTYEVHARNNQVVITVVPDQASPADQLKQETARLRQAEAERKQAEAAVLKTEERRQALAAEVEKRTIETHAVAQKSIELEKKTEQLEAAKLAAQRAQREAESKAQAAKAARSQEEKELAELRRLGANEARLQKERIREAQFERERAYRERANAETQRQAAVEVLRKVEAERNDRLASAARDVEQAKQARAKLALELERAEAANQRALKELKENEKKSEALRAEAQAGLAAAERQRAESLDKSERIKQETEALLDAQKRALKAATEADQQRGVAERLRREEEERLSALQKAWRLEELEARKQSDGRKLERQAAARAAELERQSAELKAAAEAARKQLERIAAAKQQIAGDSARRTREELAALDKTRTERLAEQARLESLRAAAEELSRTRQKEAKALYETQAEARRVVAERAARLEELTREREARVLENRRAQLQEEARMEAQAAEMARASEAQINARRGEAHSAEARATEATRKTHLAEKRLLELRSSAEKLAQALALSEGRLEAAKRERAQLVADQEIERKRVDEARLTTERVLQERKKALAEAHDAALVASGSRQAIAAAESEARKLLAERTREAAGLEKIRAEAAVLAARRTAERLRFEETVAAAKKQGTQKQDELSALQRARSNEERRLLETRQALVKVSAEWVSEKARLEERRQLAANEAAQLEKTQAAAQAARRELGRLESERLSKLEQSSTEHSLVEAKLAVAKRQLADLENRAQHELALVPTPAKLSERTVSKYGRIANVRFDDSAEGEVVLIDLPDSVEYHVVSSDKHSVTLQLSGAELPQKLERTLDAAAYHGPVKTVSTFADPNQPGAVKLVVALDGSGSTGNLTRQDGRLRWQFPRVTSQSFAPGRVSPYSLSQPLEVAQATANMGQARKKKVYSGRRIDLDFKDGDIHNVLRMLADYENINVITSDDVKGTVTMRMHDVPWDQALETILKSKGLGMQREGNLIRVAPNAVLEKELEAEIARAKAAVELKPLDTRLIPLSYAKAEDMMPRVQDILSPRGKVSIDSRTNMLIVSDIAANIALAEDLVRNLDTQTPQVLIEARVVEVNTNFQRSFGIQWGGQGVASAATGNPTGIAFPSTIGLAGGNQDTAAIGPNSAGLLNRQAASPNYVVNLPAAVGTGAGGALGMTFGSVAGTFNVNLRLSALENTGEVRIVSSPKIMTLDNMEATIEQGVAIPISVVSAAGTNTVFIDAKLNLTVKPHVTNEGSVIMNVAIMRNEPDFAHLGARGDPTIIKKQAKTEMLVRDGDTAVIGGIFSRNASYNFAKVPWFSEIPVLGWLFKNHSEQDNRTEMLIFITPRIVNRAIVHR